MILYYFETNFNKKVIDWLTPIFENDLFTEYIANDRKGLFIRIEKGIPEKQLIRCYIEPQLNLSRTIKDNSTCPKIQLSIVKFRTFHYESKIKVLNLKEIGIDVGLNLFTGCQFVPIYKMIKEI